MSAFEQLEKIGKKPIIAKIGGFRPEEHINSWFGGNFLLGAEEWPKDENGYMIPLLQISISEVPNGREIFGNIKLLQIYISREHFISPVKNGEGWKLIEYKSIKGLNKQATPEESNILKPFQIKWTLENKFDYPCWEESWEYVDMTEINESEELNDVFFEKYSQYERTKIGGYASYIQSPITEGYEYIMQITSEEKPNFMIGDNGNIYIYKSREDKEWYLHWDCY